MSDPLCFRLADVPVHLGLGGVAVPLAPFTGDPDWYVQYAGQTASDGVEGRLVTVHTFAEPWDSWEVHPSGDELVLCVEGSIVLHQEKAGVTRTVTLEKGEAVINPPGWWHTADVTGSATALFITAGVGTEHRAR
jgi:mannose-6-phosphate isomerase-like protein (cupin superfamily)